MFFSKSKSQPDSLIVIAKPNQGTRNLSVPIVDQEVVPFVNPNQNIDDESSSLASKV